MTVPEPPQPLDEARATALATEAVDLVGGPRMVYRSPRQAFSPNASKTIVVDGVPVEVRFGEISSPAIATVAGWVFEITDDGLDLLVRPPRPRA